MSNFSSVPALMLACLAPLAVSTTALPLFAAQQPQTDATPVPARWELQNSTTKANLRGIHAVDGGVAWASGANGAILRTKDSGHNWKSCAIPPDAEKLDFRGIQAWDANTAIVMSSGPGDQSRLYKTTDGCSTWKLLYTNPDKDGFWDALVFSDSQHGFLFGDPVAGRFFLALTLDGGASWQQILSKDLSPAAKATGAFAASNSALVLAGPMLGPVNVPWFGTSGPGGAYVFLGGIDCTMGMAHENPAECLKHWDFTPRKLPLNGDNSTSGVFSLAIPPGRSGVTLAIAVGGDYKKPNEPQGTAAWTADGGRTWTAATKPPHGYRSAVAWLAADNAHPGYWIAAGTNGSDASYDDGKTWVTLDTGNWNALSLPWIVGPEGRIAKLISLKQEGKQNSVIQSEEK